MNPLQQERQRPWWKPNEQRHPGDNHDVQSLQIWLGNKCRTVRYQYCQAFVEVIFGHWAMIFQRSSSSHAVQIDVFDLTKSLQFAWPPKAGSRTVQPVRSFLRVFNSSSTLNPLQPESTSLLPYRKRRILNTLRTNYHSFSINRNDEFLVGT